MAEDEWRGVWRQAAAGLHAQLKLLPGSTPAAPGQHGASVRRGTHSERTALGKVVETQRAAGGGGRIEAARAARHLPEPAEGAGGEMTRRGELRVLSIAPMMGRTDRHWRYYARQLTKKTLLYTEMVTAKALLHGNQAQLLDFDPSERPLSLQLGGSDRDELARCAAMAEQWGYDEVNLNCGCPSQRVAGAGRFGAALMAEPERVGGLVKSMRSATGLPVTVKHRIGIDELDSFDHLLRFVDVVAEAGADRFTVHARKAWLSGLSPKQNRCVCPRQ